MTGGAWLRSQTWHALDDRLNRKLLAILTACKNKSSIASRRFCWLLVHDDDIRVVHVVFLLGIFTVGLRYVVLVVARCSVHALSASSCATLRTLTGAATRTRHCVGEADATTFIFFEFTTWLPVRSKDGDIIDLVELSNSLRIKFLLFEMRWS